MRHGPLEVHLTVECGSPSALDGAVDALGRVAKVSRVVLSVDEGPAQTMVTWHSRLPLAAAVREAELVRAEFAERSVEVRRLKIECALADSTEVDAIYLEHHVLVEVDQGSEKLLATIAAGHDARQSRLPKRTDGQVVHRFINQRWWRPDEPEQGAGSFRRLRNELTTNGVRVVRSIEERVLMDTNLNLDGDWLTSTSSTKGFER